MRLHDALEIFQVALLTSVGGNLSKFPNAPDFWKQIKEKKDIDLPFKAEFDAFNKVRVNFKHYAVLADTSEMRRTAQFIPSFFTHVCQQVLGLGFGTVSLADLVEHTEARGLIKNAESLIDSCQAEKAITELAKAFCVLMAEKHGEKSLQAGMFVRLFNSAELKLPDVFLRELQRVRSTGVADLKRFLEGVKRHLKETEELLESLGWGIDIQRYKRFRFLTPHVSRASSGTLEVVLSSSLRLAIEDAEFCLEFVIDAALSIQRARFSALDGRGFSWFG